MGSDRNSPKIRRQVAFCVDGVFLDAMTGTAVADSSPKALCAIRRHPTAHAAITRDGRPVGSSDEGRRA